MGGMLLANSESLRVQLSEIHVEAAGIENRDLNILHEFTDSSIKSYDFLVHTDLCVPVTLFQSSALGGDARPDPALLETRPYESLVILIRDDFWIQAEHTAIRKIIPM